MIKVAYDYQIFSLEKYGGISRYIYEIAKKISKVEGFDVKVLAFAYINQYLKDDNSNLVVGLPIPRIPKTSKINSKINAETLKLWLRSDRPDIVHETYYQPKKVAPKNSKVVVTVHDMISEKFSSLFSVYEKISLVKAKAIEKADHIICVSENTKRDLLEILDVNPLKVSVVYNGYSLRPNFDSHISSVRVPQPYVLYVGQRWGYKNFQRLLKAFASSRKLKDEFSLVCFGSKAFSYKELSLIKNLGLRRDRITQLSGNDSVLMKLYQNASAFVYPSLYEGFGIPLLEAMSFNCPVVCSDTSSLPEVAGDSAEFFDPYEFESIAEALENVLYSSARTKELVRLGQERSKLFSWDACAEKTRAVYSSLI